MRAIKRCSIKSGVRIFRSNELVVLLAGTHTDLILELRCCTKSHYKLLAGTAY